MENIIYALKKFRDQYGETTDYAITLQCNEFCNRVNIFQAASKDQ